MGAAAGIWKIWHNLGLYTGMKFATARHVIRQQYAEAGELFVRIDTSPFFVVGRYCGHVDDTDLAAFVVACLSMPLDMLAALEPGAQVEVRKYRRTALPCTQSAIHASHSGYASSSRPCMLLQVKYMRHAAASSILRKLQC
jgi:hypothetical protein